MKTCSFDGCYRATPQDKGDRCSSHHRQVGSQESRACAGCGATFTYVVVRGPRQRYCGSDCRSAAANGRGRAKRKDARASICCRQCGAAIPDAESAKRELCSKRCSSAWYRAHEARQCSEPDCDKPLRARGLCATHYNRGYHPDRHKRWPGNPEVRRRALRRKTQKRRAVANQVEAETVDRDKVGDRDGWRCGICRRKVDRTLPWPHPKSASLDHVVPISQDGPHTYANCRIAHLDCNLRRSNKGGGEQLALIG